MGNAATVPADVRKTMGQVADIDLLGVLAPLKMTAAQVDKLQEALKAAVAKDEETRKKDYEAVRALAADVEKARGALIRGETLDPEVAARLAKANTEMAARSDEAHQEAVSKVTALVKDSLTDTQFAAVQERFLKYLKDTKSRLTVPSRLKNNAAGTQEFVRDSAVSWLVEQVLLNARIPALLTALRPAAATPPAAEKGNTTAPPPLAKP